MKDKLAKLFKFTNLFKFKPTRMVWFLWLTYPCMGISAFGFITGEVMENIITDGILTFVFGWLTWEFHAGFTAKLNKIILNNPMVGPYFDKIYEVIGRERKLFNTTEIRHLIKVLKQLPSIQSISHDLFLTQYKLNNFKYTELRNSKANIWLSRIDKRVSEGSVVDAAAIYYFYLYIGSIVNEFDIPRKGKVVKRAINLYNLHHSQ